MPERSQRPGGARSPSRVRVVREVSLYPMAICRGCGRTLLVGEETKRLAREQRIVEVCSVCARRLFERGFRRAA